MLYGAIVRLVFGSMLSNSIAGSSHWFISMRGAFLPKTITTKCDNSWKCIQQMWRRACCSLINSLDEWGKGSPHNWQNIKYFSPKSIQNTECCYTWNSLNFFFVINILACTSPGLITTRKLRWKNSELINCTKFLITIHIHFGGSVKKKVKFSMLIYQEQLC